MKTFSVQHIRYFVILSSWIVFLSSVPNYLQASAIDYSSSFFLPPDTIPLRYPFKDREIYSPPTPEHQLFLRNPSSIKVDVEYDGESKQYILTESIGSLQIRPPIVMDFEEYLEYDASRALNNYWREKSLSTKGETGDGIIPSIYIGGEAFDKVFGGSTIDVRPNGSAELIFGIRTNKNDDPSLAVRQRKTVNFDFQEKIQMNVIAKVGDKIEFKANYNTESSFDFENKIQLKYEGKEDEIIKLLEVGNVNLPLNSTLIQGSQSLFGVKTKMQFGRTTVTAVVSQQQSETKNVTVEGGAQTNTFKLTADQYEDNKHFFLSQYFYEHYNQSLSNLPIVQSNVNITKIEVWITNIGAAVTDNRNIVAFQDLGEKTPYHPALSTTIGAPEFPSNNANNLLTYLDVNQLRNINTVSNYLKSNDFTAGQDFEKIESARKLLPTEYTFNSLLGFISLNTTINPDQSLAVAFQYTIVGDTTVYQVGEFSDGGISSPNCLVAKLLKSTTVNTRIPLWKLMMKNVYAIGAYQVNRQDFILNILYSGNNNGVPTGYLNEGEVAGIPLVRVMGFDNLDQQLNPPPDGIFDFIDNAAIQGGTFQSSNGRIYFPVVEPFGRDLRQKIGNDQLANKYCYDSLYTLTKVGAQQYPEKNKFILEGFYKSSVSSEISLNALNIPQGSVKVTHGGIPLTENVDYTVDYTMGRVKIINEALLSSGTPINISLESNTMFSIQSKTYLGTHIDYEISKDFILGATIINLSEKPLTQKTILGEDPISNTIWGLNVAYQKESLWLTRLLDKLPLYSTSVPSKIAFTGEFAHFIPGHSSAIGSTGTSYIDDFEAAKSTIDLRLPNNWFLASTPQGQTAPGMFPEAALGTGLAYGFNRAALSWYIIDPIFYDRTGTVRPKNVTKDELSRNVVRQVLENEVFPAKEIPNGVPTNIAILNIDFYPSERGPYNYDVAGVPGLSHGIDAEGNLRYPTTRWGGMMRKIESTDFEAANVEYIEFWMMDPFSEDPDNPGGEVYFNLGDISEDILRDGKKSFENGLPVGPEITDVDTTIWGRVPRKQSLVNAFDNDPQSRQYQDVGYDGLSDEDERSFFDQAFLQQIINLYGAGSQAYLKAYEDPSSDNFQYFRGTALDNDEQYASVLARYKKYQGPDGNSPTAEQTGENYTAQSTSLPNVEDINLDNTLSEDERYFQYRIDLRPDKMIVGENYITDIYQANNILLENGERGSVKWYQFKIPISDPQFIVGNIQDFKSIRFMRMFFKNWQKPITTRFATFELVRGDWRRYRYDLLSPGEYIPNDEQSMTRFEISTVNVEENGSKYPIPYVIPPGIEREINYGTTNFTRLNEQAMVLRVKELQDGDARAAYKTTGFDFRQYHRLKMFVHAEDIDALNPNNEGDLTIFLRLGSDFTQNYYEYEIPLSFTPWGTAKTNPALIWPDENSFDIDLDKLVQIKQDRNIQMRNGEIPASLTIPYVTFDGKNKVTIVGTPSISDVRAIMIGVRNPKKQSFTDADDGQPKSAEIWINELRLTDFNDQSGWAATGRLTVNLADLGNVSVNVVHSTPGFGSIEKKVNERQKETITSYDFATNLQLGKFLPEKVGLRVPMHFDYSTTVASPQYNPLDPDVKLKNELDSYQLSSQKDSIRKLTEDYTQRKNINFMNVRKERVGTQRQPKPWDIENFDFTYSYSELNRRNIDIEYDNKRAYRGGIGYTFMTRPKVYRPFEKIGLVSRSKDLQLIKDFNFSLVPRMFSFRTDINREYTERKLRNKSQALVLIEPTYMKSYVWTRMYDYKHDLTQGLKLEYNANANALIDELPGSVDKDDYGYTVKEKKDQIREELLGFGTMNQFNQVLNLNYTIPINKIRAFNWMTATARYQGTYNWTASPKSIQEVMGNKAENSNTVQLNGNIRLTSLYNKVPYFKKVLSTAQTQRGGPQPPRPGQRQQPAPQNPEQADTAKTAKPKVDYFKIISESLVKIVLGFKDGSLSYAESNGIFLPGFKPSPGIIGNDMNLNAPGVPFVFGSQADIRQKAALNGWLTGDSLFNMAYATKHTSTLNARLTYEPFRDFRVEFTANRTYAMNYQEYFRVNSGEYTSYSPVESGSFSISWFSLNTSFKTPDKNNISEPFENMKIMRKEIAMRLAQENPNWQNDPQIVDSTGFPVGYGPTSQEVLHYSFLAAYSGKNAMKVSLDAFPKIPLPNWRITYKGLKSISFIKKYFKEFTLSHAYRSTYNVGNYSTNVLYFENNGAAAAFDDINNYIPKYQISQIAITEQFVPLFGIDMTWTNNVLSKLEFKKSRNLALSFVNNQLTEINSNEFVVGIGYRFKDIEMTFRGGGGGPAQRYKSDLNLRADFSIKDNKTIIRRIEEDITQISAGQKLITINTSADYQLNERVMIRVFYDSSITNPYVSNRYSTRTSMGGISLRFTLAQ